LFHIHKNFSFGICLSKPLQ